VSYSGKSFNNRPEICLKDLCQIIRLNKSFILARTIKEYQRTLVSISNCSLRVDWCYMPPVKLVLYTSRISPFVFLSCYFLLHNPVSN
jgi:hypothetical protein